MCAQYTYIIVICKSFESHCVYTVSDVCYRHYRSIFKHTHIIHDHPESYHPHHVINSIKCVKFTEFLITRNAYFCTECLN